jgi:hypothetical protein
MTKIGGLEVSFNGHKNGFIKFTVYHSEFDLNQSGSSGTVL